MNMEQMSQTISLLERDLMRDLTAEEVALIATKGWKFFLEQLGLDDEEYSELKKVRELISAYYTDQERYEELTTKGDPDLYFTLKCILSDLEKEEGFPQFLQDLYDSLPFTEQAWLNSLSGGVREKLHTLYKENKGMGEEELGALILDEAKDLVLEETLKRLNEGEELSLTED